MPTVDWNLKATWDDKYRTRAPDALPDEFIYLHYNRSNMFEAIRRDTIRIYNALGWAVDTALIIIGGGYGWSEEVLRNDLGMTTIVTVDTSTYVHNTAAATEEQEIRDAIIAAGLDPDSGRGLGKFNQLMNDPGNKSRVGFILDEDTLTIQGRQAIRNALGTNPDVVFSELVLDSLTDTEIPLASNAMNSFPGNPSVQHYVGVLQPEADQDVDMNWKTLADWKLMLPGDTFIRTGTFEVL
jgi:hypothetical protein